MGNPKATLPTAPTRPLATLATSNHKQFRWEITIYNTYMEVEQAIVVLLQEIFPKSLVGLEVIPGMLPPLLKSKRTLKWPKILGTIMIRFTTSRILLHRSNTHQAHKGAP